ncbi:Disease resistance protein [Vitis vinifera]|uniref:Disease resistance protein n=1 Tax=Vitis vinifera TaxID=29760 RepID=A0A438KBV8_VITVI|nr:Disease resistance protein [Vitis vinifera]
MTEIINAVAAKVSEYLVAPIGRHLGYLFCYRSYTDELHNKVQKLGKARDDVLITVDEARRRGDEIRPIVQEWLNRVDEVTGEAEELKKDENKSCFHGWCPNLKSRYLLSREADKKAQVIVEVQEDRNFPDGVSYRVPLRNVTFKNYEPFESRASTVNKVMDALRDDEINKIGVWGMGGVGKTTLVKQASQLAEDEKLFTTRVYIDVSWTRDSEKLQDGIAKIQQKIADMLGLEFKGKDESTRAVELKQRLQKEKILIILDDIWKEVSLEEVGIPSKDDQKGCKIVLASRNEDLLRKDMGAKECFPLQHLPKEEAWHLFKKTAGDSVEGGKLRPIAIEVVNECEGLPIAIVTIANALKDESVAVWENALDELRSAAPTNIGGVDDKVYGCLKWSYNHLKGDEVKSLFLLCGWLSYGDISMHQLLQYAMGLDLFDHLKSLEQARNKLVALVRTLKASSLLLDGEDHRYHFGGEASRLLFMDADNKSVRMHDVVRDVARNIASKDPHRFVVREDGEEWSETDGSKYISLNCKDVYELPHRLVCPKLQFLLLQNGPSLKIPHTFFEGMNLLKVLDLSEMHFTTLPSTLHSLPNLRTLRLDRCELGDIALIGELKKLQVLSMVGSDIQQLPSQMGQLTNLRLLDLNDCQQLEVIPRNILSSLSRLECLCMKSSFTQWAAEGISDGESNACLSELNHLRHLTTIEIEVPAVELLPKEDMFFENLTRYAIFAGNFDRWQKNYETSKTLKLEQVDRSLLLRDGIGKLLKKTEELKLSNLEEVCRGPIPLRSLDNLKILDVEKCHGLKFLFLLSTARGLSQLEEMTINDCNAMQQIIACEGEFELKEVDHVGTDLQLLPKLRLLKLRHLPELMNFDYFDSNLETTSQETCSQGNPDIHMPFFSYQVSSPNLEKLILHNLPKLREIWHHQFPLGSFYNLQILKVYYCPGLLNLIPSHLIQRFDNLKVIDVDNCEVLKHVFDLQGLDENIRILPRLESLWLLTLPKMRRVVCNEDEDKNDSVRCLFSSSTAFHNLKFLSIHDYGNKVEDEEHINTPREDVVVFDGKVSFPNLEKLILDGLPKLKMIWHHQLSLESFHRLEILRVSFSPNMEELYLKSLPKLKEIDFGILPKLKILMLKKLPQLRYIICKGKNISKRCVLSPSTFKNFHNLIELHIIDCGMEDTRGVNTSTNDEVLSNEKASFLEPRASTLNKIMDALRDHNSNLIGVWGMAGVGKTTLLKQVAQQAKQQQLFTTQVHIDLSSISGLETLRQKIVEALGLPLRKPNADELKQALKEEKILIILDDIWTEIDLEKVGIPSKDDIGTPMQNSVGFEK